MSIDDIHEMLGQTGTLTRPPDPLPPGAVNLHLRGGNSRRRKLLLATRDFAVGYTPSPCP